KNKIDQLENTAKMALQNIVKEKTSQLNHFENYLKQHLFKLVSEKKQQLDHCTQIIQLLSKQQFIQYTEILENMNATIALLHPDNVLKRGYSITYHNGKAIKEANSLKPGDDITSKVYTGEVKSVVK
ncbi:MAG: exodeoxyribonuclease VII large subunit, partial [Bacteroidales bacterium]